MRRAGFSFFIAWVMVSLAVNSVAAQTPALSTVEGPAPTPVAPVPLRVLQFLADHIEIDVVALLPITRLRLEGLGRVVCSVR